MKLIEVKKCQSQINKILGFIILIWSEHWQLLAGAHLQKASDFTEQKKRLLNVITAANSNYILKALALKALEINNVQNGNMQLKFSGDKKINFWKHFVFGRL